MSSLRERELRIEDVMTEKFKAGDHVRWNSEAGFVSGTIRRVHTKDVDYKGHVHHASADEPQYEIDSDKTDHVAMHKGRAEEVAAKRRGHGPGCQAASVIRSQQVVA